MPEPLAYTALFYDLYVMYGSISEDAVYTYLFVHHLNEE